MSFILFVWLALGSFSLILHKIVTANYQTNLNQEIFIKELNSAVQNYSLGANLPKTVLDSIITKSEIKAGPKHMDYPAIKQKIVEKINQYQVQNTTSEETERDKENVNKVADEIINKIKGEINTSFLFFNQTIKMIIPITITFTIIMLINATITILLFFILFKKAIFTYLGYSLWSTGILLSSVSIILWLTPSDQLALSSKTNVAVISDIASYALSLALIGCTIYLCLGSIISYFGNRNKAEQERVNENRV